MSTYKLSANTSTSITLALTQDALPAGYSDKFYCSADWFNDRTDPLASLVATLTTSGNSTLTISGLTPGTAYKFLVVRCDGSDSVVATWSFVADDGHGGLFTIFDRDEVDFTSPWVADFSKPFSSEWIGQSDTYQAVMPPHRRVQVDGVWKLVVDIADVPFSYQCFSPRYLWSPDSNITMQTTFKVSGDFYWYFSNDMFASEGAYDGWITSPLRTPAGTGTTGGCLPINGTGTQYQVQMWNKAGYFYLDENADITLKMEYLINTPVAGQSQFNIYVNGSLVLSANRATLMQNPRNMWFAVFPNTGGTSRFELSDVRVWGTMVHAVVGGNGASHMLSGMTPDNLIGLGYTQSADNSYQSAGHYSDGICTQEFGVICARSAINGPYIGTYIDEGGQENFNPCRITAFNGRTPVLGVPVGSGKKYRYLRLYAHQGDNMAGGDYLKIYLRKGDGTLIPDAQITVVSPAARTGQVNSTGFQPYSKTDNAPILLDLSGVTDEFYLDIQGNNTVSTSPIGTGGVVVPALIAAYVDFQAGTEPTPYSPAVSADVSDAFETATGEDPVASAPGEAAVLDAAETAQGENPIAAASAVISTPDGVQLVYGEDPVTAAAGSVAGDYRLYNRSGQEICLYDSQGRQMALYRRVS